MSITTIIQKTTVSSITSVVITDIVQDASTGLWTREIRVFAPDPTDQPVVTFTLRLESQTKLNVELVAPAALF